MSSTMSASGQFRDRAAGDQAAIAQDRDAVGERAYLRHAVRNVDQRHAFAAQAPDHAEEAAALRRRSATTSARRAPEAERRRSARA